MNVTLPPSPRPPAPARTRLQGHTATVGDVCFAPGSSQLLVSVADDGRLLLWDTRAGLAPAGCVEEAHGAGVNVMCVDWCPLDENLLVSGEWAGGKGEGGVEGREGEGRGRRRGVRGRGGRGREGGGGGGGGEGGVDKELSGLVGVCMRWVSGCQDAAFWGRAQVNGP